MKKFNLSIILAVMTAACVFLSGCGNPDIDNVKKGTLGNFKNLTIGNALDNYKYFTDTNWRFLETDNGKRVVEFKGIYNVGKLCKNTEFKQLALVIQFTMRVKQGFDLSYFGLERALRNGKVKQKSLGSYKLSNCLKKIYQNQDVFNLIAPPVIRFKGRRASCFKDKTLGEIMDEYKYFTSIKWENDSFIGKCKLDKAAKAMGIVERNFGFSYEYLGVTEKYKGGKETSYYCSFDSKLQEDIPKIMLSVFYKNQNPSYAFDFTKYFKQTSDYSDLMKSKMITNKKITMSKDHRYVVFSGNYSSNERLKLYWMPDSSLMFDLCKGVMETTLKDGSKQTKIIDDPSREYDNVVRSD